MRSIKSGAEVCNLQGAWFVLHMASQEAALCPPVHIGPGLVLGGMADLLKIRSIWNPCADALGPVLRLLRTSILS